MKTKRQSASIRNESGLRILPRGFYDRPTVEVARDLIGKVIVYESPRGTMSARIVEVEGYVGMDHDPACHAARGRTARNAVMFGPPGHAYIYFIYGMYYCLNFVTERKGFGAAVLLRAAEPAEGLERMIQPTRVQPPERLLAGPGKFCRAFGLTREQNGLDLTGDRLYLAAHLKREKRELRIGVSPRIGISSGQENHWRFFDKDSKSVSKSR